MGVRLPTLVPFTLSTLRSRAGESLPSVTSSPVLARMRWYVLVYITLVGFASPPGVERPFFSLPQERSRNRLQVEIFTSTTPGTKNRVTYYDLTANGKLQGKIVSQIPSIDGIVSSHIDT